MRNIECATMQLWISQTSTQCIMWGIIIWLQVCNHLDHISGHLYSFNVSISGCLGGRLSISVSCSCMFSIFIVVQTDVDLNKVVLTCSQVALSMWKVKYLSDTESEPGISSEDEAEGLAPHRAVARCLPVWHGGASFQSPAPVPQVSEGPEVPEVPKAPEVPEPLASPQLSVPCTATSR